MWIIVGNSQRNFASPETTFWGCIAAVLAAKYEYCILLYFFPRTHMSVYLHVLGRASVYRIEVSQISKVRIM